MVAIGHSALIFEDRREEAFRGLPAEAEREVVVIE